MTVQDQPKRSGDSNNISSDVPDPEARLLETLNYSFKNRSLLLQALTHRSFLNEVPTTSVGDNERFEFLGDAVLDLVVSSELMNKFPDAREGTLSRMRSAIVSESALARLARKIELGQALRLGRGELLSGGREKPSILADSFEAVVAAIYLDSDFSEVYRVLQPLLDFRPGEWLARGDAKTELQHVIQAERQMTPTYRLIGEDGPEHEKRFRVQVLVGDEVLGEGDGRSKKEAEQRAAALVISRRKEKAVEKQDSSSKNNSDEV